MSVSLTHTFIPNAAESALVLVPASRFGAPPLQCRVVFHKTLAPKPMIHSLILPGLSQELADDVGLFDVLDVAIVDVDGDVDGVAGGVGSGALVREAGGEAPDAPAPITPPLPPFVSSSSNPIAWAQNISEDDERRLIDAYEGARAADHIFSRGG